MLKGYDKGSTILEALRVALAAFSGGSGLRGADMRMCVYIYIYIYTYRVHIYIYIHTRIHGCMCVYVYTYTFTPCTRT